MRAALHPVRTLSAALVAIALPLALAACGNDQPTTTAASTSSSGATTTLGPHGSSPTTFDVRTITTTLVDGKPHFATPEDAMRYLADAWNRNDLTDLKHVTNPAARGALDDMHKVAVDLRLDHCTENVGRGDYECYFDHDYPPHASTTMKMDDPVTGHAEFTVGPASTPGWYMTVLESCS